MCSTECVCLDAPSAAMLRSCRRQPMCTSLENQYTRVEGNESNASGWMLWVFNSNSLEAITWWSVKCFIKSSLSCRSFKWALFWHRSEAGEIFPLLLLTLHMELEERWQCGAVVAGKRRMVYEALESEDDFSKVSVSQFLIAGDQLLNFSCPGLAIARHIVGAEKQVR